MTRITSIAKFSFGLVLLMPQAGATILPAPALSCSPRNVFDGGYSLLVENDGEGLVVRGQLLQNSYAGPKPLVAEEMVLENIGRGNKCDIRIKLKNSSAAHEFHLVIPDASNRVELQGTLDLRLSGKPVPSFFRPMACQMHQGLINRVCRTRFGGGVHQGQEASDEAGPSPGTAANSPHTQGLCFGSPEPNGTRGPTHQGQRTNF